jgi:hypothetical protein
MAKRRIELHNGRATFTGEMSTEAIRGKAEEFEALTGAYPLIMVAAPITTRRSSMTGEIDPFTTPRRVLSIHRLFVRVDMGPKFVDLIPEQCQDLVVEFHLTH